MNRLKKRGVPRLRSTPQNKLLTTDDSIASFRTQIVVEVDGEQLRIDERFGACGTADELRRILGLLGILRDPNADRDFIEIAFALLKDFEQRGKFIPQPRRSDFLRMTRLLGLTSKASRDASRSYCRDGKFSVIYAMASKPPDMAMIEGHERTVLAYLMNGRDGCERFLHRIPPLSAPTHRLIVDVIRDLNDERERVNHLSISDRLEEKKKLTECGGRQRIVEIATATTSEELAEYALQRLVENYGERQAAKIAKKLAAGEISAAEATEWLSNLANKYGGATPSSRQRTIQTLLDSGLSKIQLPGR